MRWQLPAGAAAVLLLLLLLLPLVPHLGVNAASPPSGTPPSAPPPPPPPPNIVPTVTDITGAPPQVHRGQPFQIEGTVVAKDSGKPAPGVDVFVYANQTKATPGVLLGQGTTDAAGVYRIQVAVNESAADYQLVAETTGGRIDDQRSWGPSWSDPPIHVIADTTLTLQASGATGLGVPVPLQGSLRDETGSPVGGATITLTADGVGTWNVSTNADGTFATNATFQQAGNVTVQAAFAGDAHLGPSQVSIVVPIGAVAIVADPPTLLRGHAFALPGRILVGGAPLAGATVQVVDFFATTEAGGAPLRVANLTTGPDGSFADAGHVSADAALGPSHILLSVPDQGAERDVAVVVRAQPYLALRSQGTGDDASTVDVQLADDQGAPVAGAPVEVRATQDGVDAGSWTLATDATGHATVHLQGLLPSRVRLQASYAGADPLLPASAAADIALQGPLWFRALLAALAAAATIAVRARTGPLATGPTIRLAIAFPDLEPGLPAAWAPGESVRVALAATDPWGRPLPGLRVRLRWGDDDLALATDGQGRAEASRAFEEEFEGAVIATAKGQRGLAPGRASAPLRINDYRKEAGRAYEDFLRRVRSLGVPCTRATSPRELQRRLARLHPAPELEELLRTFEAANYSLRPFGRAEWVHFVALRDRVLAALPIGPPPSTNGHGGGAHGASA